MGLMVTTNGPPWLWIWELGHHSWEFRSVDMGGGASPISRDLRRVCGYGTSWLNARYGYGLRLWDD